MENARPVAHAHTNLISIINVFLELTPSTPLTIIPPHIEEVVEREGEHGLMVMVMAMATGPHVSQCVWKRISISAWLGKLSAGGALPAQWTIRDFL